MAHLVVNAVNDRLVSDVVCVDDVKSIASGYLLPPAPAKLREGHTGTLLFIMSAGSINCSYR